jgi:hypothetical protein
MAILTIVIMSQFNMYPRTTYFTFEDLLECEKYKDYIEQYYDDKFIPNMVHCDNK